MSEQDNTRVVQEVYAAFGRGDIPFILGSLADRFDWSHHGPVDVIPWAKERHTKDEVAEFFSTLDETVTFEQFEPRQFVAQGDTVVALGWWRARAKATGRTVEEYWAMEWKLADGKITRYRAYDDTSAIAAALQPA
jgi:ketosteroid isomerase-like protein